MSTLPTLPDCGQPASHRVEGYSPANGLLHGRLDLSVDLCEDHLDRAYRLIVDAGFTPHSTPIAGPYRCGHGFDYEAKQPIGPRAQAGAR